ncbi:DMT family transporter [Streptacidiphilus sp. ASG 303]|uniref:DMT family transporter n=1 Tax=Streptacidiphilus sp. ASG 303 TaxID=2896847 RepID=UPI001E47D0B8|nr:DMT family transporter [Streptacidiphilus sp. ASG 303]MCD0480974.1 DMT family transporter [Streptacidiphilus sp. ASG 303]
MDSPNAARNGALLAAVATLAVGSSFTAGSVLSHYPVLGGQALRYGAAALLLGALAARRGGRPLRTLRGLTAREWARLAVLAATGMVGFNAAVLAAERHAEPAVPGVVVGCAPLVLAVLGPLLAGRRPSARLAAAGALVAGGAAVVQGLGRTDTAGLLLSLLALAGEVAFALVAVPLLGVLGPVLTSAAACAAAAGEAGLSAAVLDGGAALRVPTAAEAAALAWYTLPVTVLAFCCWYTAVQRLGAERAGLFSGLVPVAAALSAPLAGAGVLGPAQLAGTGLVSAGVLLGSLTERQRPVRRQTVVVLTSRSSRSASTGTSCTETASNRSRGR